MTEEPQLTLLDLDDTDLTVADPKDDVRGAKVVDRDGEEVGDVDGLLIDDQEKRVRFLQVGSGGFLGLGKKERLIPVDAVTAVDDAVHIDMTRQHVAGSPEYDPTIERQCGGYYDYYGYTPYWAPGYAYPAYPYPYR